MTKKPVITPVADTPLNASAINANLNRIADSLENTISRDGSTPCPFDRGCIPARA